MFTVYLHRHMIYATPGKHNQFTAQLEPQLAYWKQQLAGTLPIIELPTDRPRAASQSYQGARQAVVLPSTVVTTLNAFSQQEESTLFMTLLAALNVLLYRYTGQQDILVGSPILTRNRVEQQEQIELVNTLVLRTNLSGDPTFAELLAQVRQMTLAAYANSDLPFQKLVKALNSELNLNDNSLFQVMFVLENAPTTSPEPSSWVINSLEQSSATTTKVDLALVLKETSQGVDGYVEYNSNLFEAATIDRLIGHFQTLLQAIVTAPEQGISDLPLMNAAERQTLLVDWNQTQTDYPKSACIHQLFEAQVERTPEAVAITFEDQSLTYRQLNDQANQLAHYLQALGVKPDVLVALCVERSLEMVVGLLGILKAGGGYVPLDPAYPPDRVGFMLSDAQVPVLLTQNSLVTGLPEHEAQVVCLDTDWETISQSSQDNPISTVASNHLAYVIYTSGSTGKPKGVQLCHQSVINFLLSMGQQPGLTDQDILVAVTTISFDIAVLELYLPLIMGAKVVLVGRDVATNGVKLLEKLTHSGATIMQATPATWRLLLASAWESTPRLKILCGGEAMPRELANQLLDKSTSLWNVYGPTETTVWSTAHKVEASRLLARSQDAPESIGRPIANTQIYLLDAHLQPVPIGIPGELHIGGDGLARGYLNRPELTEEKFIPDPFSDAPGARLYKTGDLARYLPNGNIDYIGRIDHQVKIRGFRIELGEIEAVLAKHLAVKQAVVIAREDVPGEKRLVAYLTCHPEQNSATSELRSFLKEQLTDYMVPAAFVRLHTLPLTPNGKVDRRALPAPESVKQEPSETLVAPRDELELELTKIWEKVLGIQSIGVTDNLFDLGGHSLLVARLSDQINKAFHKNLPLATIFQAPTVEQLASILRQEEHSVPQQALAAIQPLGTKPPLFLCEGVSIYHPLVPYLGLEQPLYGLVIPIRDGKDNASNGVEARAAQYIQEMRTFQPEGPYFLGGLSFGGIVAFEMAQQLIAQGQQVALLVLFDTILPDAYKVVPLGKRIGFHLSKFLQLGPNYVLEHSKAQFQVLKQKAIKAYVKTCQSFGYFLPNTLEYIATKNGNDQAAKQYVPQVYSGQVILFKATERVDMETSIVDPDLGWGSLVAGGLEIYEIPSDHVEMLKEPLVKMLAEQLKACLDQT